MDTNAFVKSSITIMLSVIALVIVTNTQAGDPTQPFFSEISKPVLSAPKKLSLQAIYRRSNGMEAVINGTVLKEGDYILGIRINKIGAHSVHYSKSRKRGVLTLHQRFLKKSRVEG